MRLPRVDRKGFGRTEVLETSILESTGASTLNVGQAEMVESRTCAVFLCFVSIWCVIVVTLLVIELNYNCAPSQVKTLRLLRHGRIQRSKTSVDLPKDREETGTGLRLS